MTNPFIIMSAPNGARRQKKDHMAIPISPDEMAICAKQILSSGASILHLHVRNNDGSHSLDVDRYRASIAAIKEMVGNELIIQATTESVGIYNRHQQMEMVKTLKPEATSLALRELCPSDSEISEFSQFVKWVKTEHIFPQYILYNKNDVDRFERYRKQGVFHDNDPFALFVLGNYQNKDTDDQSELLKKISVAANFPWAVCGFGENEKDCVYHSVKNNGHIRVGFENNIWRNQNELLSDNAEMIKHCADIATEHNRKISSASDVRNIFNLKG